MSVRTWGIPKGTPADGPAQGIGGARSGHRRTDPKGQSEEAGAIAEPRIARFPARFYIHKDYFYHYYMHTSDIMETGNIDGVKFITPSRFGALFKK
jgi:hypothetical protein